MTKRKVSGKNGPIAMSLKKEPIVKAPKKTIQKIGMNSLRKRVRLVDIFFIVIEN